MKKIYGLLGKDIEYSFSRNYFNTKFEAENTPAHYINFDLSTIADFPKEVLKTKNLSGINVTIPYKEEVMAFLDRLDPEAEAIGAVNVIKLEKDGSLTGYNSDCYGFKHALLPLLENKPMPKKALILGTGGASKAVAYSLAQLGIGYQYVSRTPKQGQFTYSDLSQDILSAHLLIINTTPLGTFPAVEKCPDIPYEFLTPNHKLFDLVYNPNRTEFLKRGEAQGASIRNGEKMLELQALRAYEIWGQ